VLLLGAGGVLSVALVVVTLETHVVVLEVLTEVLMEEAAGEVMEEAAMAVAGATIRLKEKVSKEGPMWAFFFVQSLLPLWTNFEREMTRAMIHHFPS